ALSAPAFGEEMIFVYPGKPGTQAEAKNVLGSFTGYIETRTGWAPGSLHATYFNDEPSGAKALQGDARPAYGVLSLGVYVKWKKEGRKLALLAQSERAKQVTERFHLLVPKDSKIESLKTARGANLA